MSGAGGAFPTSADHDAPVGENVAFSGMAVVSPAMVPTPSLNFQFPTRPAGLFGSSAW